VTFDIVTIFPAMIEPQLAAGMLGRAAAAGVIDVKIHDLRDFTIDRHRVVDDMPYGGGPGMVLKPDPIFRALDAIEAERGRPITVVLTSPQGTRFTQAEARRLSQCRGLVLLCGRYEGFDERIRERVDEELSIGDYVLTGGELPAMVVLDAVARLVPGVVGDEQSVVHDSFTRGLLDFPQYTRPVAISTAAPETRRANAQDSCRATASAEPLPDSDRANASAERVLADSSRARASADPVLTESRSAKGSAERVLRVPDVLLSGNHAEISRWRKRQAVARTLDRRPDLLAAASLDEEEQEILRELEAQRSKADSRS
jgi:tRNA (guanine37-N1)-methyltransferase